MSSKTKHSAEVTATKSNLPTTYDYSAYAGQGFESQTRDDYTVPFLGILQANSPLLQTKASAKAGMLVNTVTQDVFEGKDGIAFIPVDTQHVVVEWKPRNLGGGFVAMHQLSSELITKVKAEQEFGKYKTTKGDPNSNDLIETFYVYGIFVHPNGSSEQMLIAFTSTKIKTYKRWMTKARAIQLPLPDGRRINPPLFAHRYRITTQSEKNAKGSFFNFQIDFDGEDASKCRLATTDAHFQEAVSFFELLKEGKIKAAFDTQEKSDGEEEDIPFN
jgi:hypothetical protein